MASEQALSHTFVITGRDFARAGSASLEIREIIRELGIEPSIVRRTAIAAYEAEMNMVHYAERGQMVLTLNPEMIRITTVDEGPGIEDIELAMQEGYSTATEEIREMGFGAGMGLPNIKKNVDLFELTSTVGRGTSYNIIIRLEPRGKA